MYQKIITPNGKKFNEYDKIKNLKKLTQKPFRF
jgi:hypothetical protein